MADSINAVVNYTRDDGKRGMTGGDPSLVPRICAVDVKMLNGRKHKLRLAECGFELANHPTKLSTDDFYNNPNKVSEEYYPELHELVAKVTGASRVYAFHHMCRTKNPKRSNTQTPAHAVHCDYSVRNSLKLYAAMKRDGEQRGRYAVINCWRNISDKSPIMNEHLAMCDSRSIVAPDDFIICDVKNHNGEVNESYRLEPSHAEFHKWYYFPKMAKDEVLIFMQYDSDSKAQARYTFHTAFMDPTCPSDAPPRESIETRLIAFFPDHPTNTIPNIVMTADELVEKGVTGIMSAIRYPNHWPEHGRLWMRNTLYKEGGVEEVIRALVNGAVERRENMMDKCTPKQVAKVIELLLNDKVNFKKIASANFPEGSKSDKINDYVNGLIQGAQWVGKWPPAGKQWLNSLKGRHNFGKTILLHLFEKDRKDPSKPVHGIDSAGADKIVAVLTSRAQEWENEARKHL